MLEGGFVSEGLSRGPCGGHMTNMTKGTRGTGVQDTSTEGGQNEGRLWRTLDVAHGPLRVRVGNGRALAWSTASPTIRMRGARNLMLRE